VSASPARIRAREVISQVRERSGFAHEVFDSRLRTADLPPAEVALATRLTYGTLQTEGTLDEALARYLEGKKLEPRVRDALRLAAYELLFLRTPSRAAVHQGVELVRAIRPQAAGLANAVLRRLAQDAPAFPWGDPGTDVAALARLHGHPLWLAEMWVAELGRDAAAAVMAADNEPAPLYVALNPFAGTTDEASAALEADGAVPTPCPVAGCFELGDAAHAVHGSALRDGLVVACDAAAQMVVQLVGARQGQRILEVGSGRGTKTLLLQGAAVGSGGPADICALDVHAFKARLLAERLSRFGVPGVTALVGDARDIAAVQGIGEVESFDAVLIDAPCSGLGTLRRHPEKRWRLASADLDALGDLGLCLLEQAAALVRRGGFVVYSTCTVTRRENAEVVESFLAGKQGSDWYVDPLANDIPAPWGGFVTEEGYFSSLPASGGSDGHFAARLVKS
jgi:16S rRNA (cytosine967-C5)-methyltransferase